MKKGKIMIGVVLVVFLIYNFIWYFGCYKIYSDYQKGLPNVGNSGVKIYVDEDNYQYSVNLPTYLYWDGNLAVTKEDTMESLIIWLGMGGKAKEEGIILNYENEQVQVELKSSKQAVDSENQEFVDKNQKKLADSMKRLLKNGERNYEWSNVRQ